MVKSIFTNNSQEDQNVLYDDYQYSEFDYQNLEIYALALLDENMPGSETTSLYDNYNDIIEVKTSNSGRKKKPFTLIFERFFNNQCHHPKKEFFNAFMIRAIKRSFRIVAKNLIPKKTSIKVTPNDSKEMALWNILVLLYQKNPDHIKKISTTISSPLTDAKTKRKPSMKKDKANSYNNNYCKNFFQDLYMQVAFYVIAGILFADPSPNALIKKFKFKCCQDSTHTIECIEKWAILKEFLENKYFKDLGIRDFSQIRSSPRSVFFQCFGERIAKIRNSLKLE
ncbi:hypothetical protein SteCoe_18343 [Stentor coeruleus]|uniref:Uncharacterized protein n=1 Tax=Stentor coeruleus TaxID=5963 RepID=A0A1R2BWW1_9CILI|nr:hypothetical protein SteCoe_18343 [Stentor coeruleus]